MNEAKLVYTTEEKMAHNNIQFYDESIANEARSNMRETIQEINKSRKRIVVMNSKAEKCREEKLPKVTKIVKTLMIQPATTKELSHLIFPEKAMDNKKKTYMRNLLQTIRVGSDEIIASENNMWRINEKYISGEEKLISRIMNNLGARFRTKVKKTPAQKSAPIVPASISNITNTTTTLPTNIIISGDQEAITVPVKIALTIQVKIEVIQ